MLVLFKPFRAKHDFIPRTGSFDDMYTYWWSHEVPDTARFIVENSNDYYTSKELARQRSDHSMERFHSSIEVGSLNLDEYNDQDRINDSDCDDDLLPHSDDDTCEMNDLSRLESATSSIAVLENGIAASELAACSTNDNLGSVIHVPYVTEEELDQRFVLAEQAYVTPPHLESDQIQLINASDRPTRVWMLVNNGDDDERCIHPYSPHSSELGQNPTLQHVSAFFHLNQKQHKMFVRAGKKLLQAIVTPESDTIGQMIGFLGGLPGAGKSLVIHALQSRAK